MSARKKRSVAARSVGKKRKSEVADKKEDEQLTQLEEIAVLMNEIFLSFQRANFTEEQSLRLVGMVAAELIRNVAD